MPTALPLAASTALLERARQVIPLASQTFSKAPNQFVRGASPVFLARGQGSHVWDVDGNEFIDYPTALGPIILGYNDPDVTAAVAAQLGRGSIFSLPSPLEVEVAELVCDVVPCAEMVRFGKNGSDATAGAVRVARAATGRNYIAACGYHGWQDWYIGSTTRHRGVPDAVRALTLSFSYNDIASLERLFAEHPGEIAGVILEPMGVEEPREDFLARVAAITRKHGAILIFDEVVTGFRLALGGAQECFGVVPDLACLGKAIANGFPLSAVAGRRDLMLLFEEVFFSFTFGGEALSLAAAAATIPKLGRPGVLEHIHRQGTRLRDGTNALAARVGLADRIACIGHPSHTVVTFRDEQGRDSLLLRSVFQQELARRGILFLVGYNICYALSDADVAHTLGAVEETLVLIARAMEDGRLATLLDGMAVEPIFRKA